MSKKIIIIAGPNGAGKTTFTRSFLPEEAPCFIANGFTLPAEQLPSSFYL
jgi:predicted ABC-type ATPase